MHKPEDHDFTEAGSKGEPVDHPISNPMAIPLPVQQLTIKVVVGTTVTEMNQSLKLIMQLWLYSKMGIKLDFLQGFSRIFVKAET